MSGIKRKVIKMKKVTILDLQKRKDQGQPITMLTAYDYGMASLVDEAGIDIILVGDSVGMVVMGLESTVPVTMHQMLYHCQLVARGSRNAFLVGDMPFLSYQTSPQKAVYNAGRFLKEAGMEAVKLEGGQEMAQTITAVVRAGIPVMGHIGLTPQSVSQLGGYRVQGKTAVVAQKLLDDALALEAAGCFSLVLEAVPAPVASAISQRLHIPTIGIGAGPGCDGQVLVYHDLLGLFDKLQPRFVKRYAELRQTILDALTAYRQEVTSGQFPTESHTYPMDTAEYEAFAAYLSERET
jgi:3-methyl-2-oxobutanoate hydroxymethyltransferase